MTITIYGIKSCSTMKKAFTKLDEMNIAYQFHDYKKLGIEREEVVRWVEELGINKVLNKRGTTWRKLSDEQKLSADANVDTAIDLLIANTSMLKRPIIEGGFNEKRVLLCGFDAEEYETVFES